MRMITIENKKGPKIVVISSNASVVKPMDLLLPFTLTSTTNTTRMMLRKKNTRPKSSIPKKVDRLPRHQSE